MPPDCAKQRNVESFDKVFDVHDSWFRILRCFAIHTEVSFETVARRSQVQRYLLQTKKQTNRLDVGGEID